MATLGKIQEFKSEDETIEAYLERMQLFIDANSIKDDKKVGVLLSVIGSKIYGILRNVLAPEKPNEKTYDQLTAALKAHFNPKPVVITGLGLRDFIFTVGLNGEKNP